MARQRHVRMWEEQQQSDHKGPRVRNPAQLPLRVLWLLPSKERPSPPTHTSSLATALTFAFFTSSTSM